VEAVVEALPAGVGARRRKPAKRAAEGWHNGFQTHTLQTAKLRCFGMPNGLTHMARPKEGAPVPAGTEREAPCCPGWPQG